MCAPARRRWSPCSTPASAADDSATASSGTWTTGVRSAPRSAPPNRSPPGAASNQLLVATSLRDRLPKVAAMFAAGALTYQLASTIVWRTAAIKDPDALRAVDTEMAAAIADWPPMSQAQDHHRDRRVRRSPRPPRAAPHARTRPAAAAWNRLDDARGAASLWATLFAHDAKALDQRLDALADTVCDADPRTPDQRRADALGALANGADRLACLCGQTRLRRRGTESQFGRGLRDHPRGHDHRPERGGAPAGRTPSTAAAPQCSTSRYASSP